MMTGPKALRGAGWMVAAMNIAAAGLLGSVGWRLMTASRAAMARSGSRRDHGAGVAVAGLGTGFLAGAVILTLLAAGAVLIARRAQGTARVGALAVTFLLVAAVPPLGVLVKVLAGRAG